MTLVAICRYTSMRASIWHRYGDMVRTIYNRVTTLTFSGHVMSSVT